MSKNSIDVKNNVPFLKPDINHHHDYELVKAHKHVLNLPKHQLYNNHHSTLHDFTINVKNTFNEYPWNGTGFYLDFDLPQVDYQYHQFVLRFKLYNRGSVAYTLPFPLCIDRLVLLKNSNVLTEINNEDILLYNLQKVASKYRTYNDDFNYSLSTGLSFDSTDKSFINPYIPSNSTYIVNMELPLPLTNSHFPSNLIKNQLTIRVYFKGSIVTSSTGANSDIGLKDVKLMLRMKETAHNIYKEPKFNHLFTKKLLTKINIPKLDADNNYVLNITGFNSVASFALVFIRDQESDILHSSVGKWHQYKYRMDQVSIQDNTGKNILYSDMIMENDYNRYLINENFKEFGYTLNKMTQSFNDGHIVLLPFCFDASLAYNGNFNGGYSFQSSNDYKIKFKSLTSSNNKSVVLNILWFSPAVLELCYGDLLEMQS